MQAPANRESNVHNLHKCDCQACSEECQKEKEHSQLCPAEIPCQACGIWMESQPLAVTGWQNIATCGLQPGNSTGNSRKANTWILFRSRGSWKKHPKHYSAKILAHPSLFRRKNMLHAGKTTKLYQYSFNGTSVLPRNIQVTLVVLQGSCSRWCSWP